MTFNTSNTPERRPSGSPSTLLQIFRRRGSVVPPVDVTVPAVDGSESPKSPKSPKVALPVSVSVNSVRSNSPSPPPERRQSGLRILRFRKQSGHHDHDSDNNSASDTDYSTPHTPEPEPGRELAATHVATEAEDRNGAGLGLQVESAQPAHEHEFKQVLAPTTGVIEDVSVSAEATTTTVATAPKRGKTNQADKSGTLLAKFVDGHKELEAYKSGSKQVFVSGHHLTLPAVVAAARYAHLESTRAGESGKSKSVSITLDESDEAHHRVAASRAVLDDKLAQNKSIYGVSTGFGGSADTRTEDHDALGDALLQHQAAGVLALPKHLLSEDTISAKEAATNEETAAPLPLSDPLMSTSMPESWVRGAMLIRANSLVRGHSAVRWELIERMVKLLEEDVVPVVPLRGSISASGDLSPLSYVAGLITGNPSIYAYAGPRTAHHRQIVPSTKALAQHELSPLVLKAKEHLGILNGTAFSCSVGSLALHECVQLAVLAQVCTALGVEALLGCAGSFARFVSDIARPHPGQVEVAATVRQLLKGSKLAIGVEEDGSETKEEELTIEEDKGKLRQDRYALRTAPQFIGPQLEDMMSALKTLEIECNSTTDNPLVEAETQTVHHGGNFQAMAVSSAMEKTRLSLHHLGKILFAQCTELINPAMNRGLPPNLAATDPSLNFFAKAIDIACAAYVSELGYLANPVTTHIQSAEMHNQAVNSLALISARATIQAIEVLTMLISSYLHALCQALDLRAMQDELDGAIKSIVHEEVQKHFGGFFQGDSSAKVEKLYKQASVAVLDSIEATSTMDNKARMEKAARATTTPVVEFFLTSDTNADSESNTAALKVLPAFRDALASRMAEKQHELRVKYLTGAAGTTPASKLLGRTKSLYEFIRVDLGVRMHGRENLDGFDGGIGKDERTVGGEISVIYEAIRSGRMQSVLVNLFEEEA